MACSIGVSTSTKPVVLEPSAQRADQPAAQASGSRRVRSLAHRSTSRWRKRVSTSVTPFHLSPKPRRASASSTQCATWTDSSPLRVRTTLPVAPTQSPSDSLEKASKSSVIFCQRRTAGPDPTSRAAWRRPGAPGAASSMTRPATETTSSLSSPAPERGVALVQRRRLRRSGRTSRGRRPQGATLPGRRPIPRRRRSRRLGVALVDEAQPVQREPRLAVLDASSTAAR